MVVVGILSGFALVGQWLFSLLGVTLAAVHVAGALVLLFVALDMLRAQRSPVQETAAETAEGAAKDDIALTPSAVPMLAGPAAISAVILLACVVLVGLASYGILAIDASGPKWLSPLAEKIITRLMGLLLAALPIQFLFNGLRGDGGLLVRYNESHILIETDWASSPRIRRDA